MNNQLLIQLMTAVVTATASSTTVAAIFNRRNRRERQAGIEQMQADTDKISAEAAATAIEILRKELNAAQADLDKRRTIIAGQDRRIDRQQEQIRRLRNQVFSLQERHRVLEEWVRQAVPLLEANGITGLPAPPPMRQPVIPPDDLENEHRTVAEGDASDL